MSDSEHSDDESTISERSTPEEEEASQAEPEVPQSGGLLRPAILDSLIEPDVKEQLELEHGSATLNMTERIDFSGGNIYTGSIVSGRFSGDGEFRWQDGVVYNGAFQDNSITGNGTMVWPNGDHYTGSFLDGKRHGHGKLVCHESTGGSTYIGTWENGKQEGSGRASYADGGFFKGEWRNGLRHGFGVMQYASGNRYEGLWEDDQRSGKGVMTWASPRQLYRGFWKDGKPHGFGECLWLSVTHGVGHQPRTLANNWYRGMWSRGVRHGQGSFHYADGSQYTGGWDQNLKQGQDSIFVYPDGRVYRGRFERDRMVDPRPAKPNDSPGSINVTLHIDDLFPAPLHNAIDARKAHRVINNILLRWNKELKQLYYYCCHVASRSTFADLQGSQDPPLPVAKVATAEAIWQVFYECSIPDRRLSMAEINRILFRIQVRPLTDPETPTAAQREVDGEGTAAQEASALRTDMGTKTESLDVKEDERERNMESLELEEASMVLERSKENSAEEEASRMASSLEPICATLRETIERDVHDPMRPVLFREYVELLIRIADQKYKFEMGTLSTRLTRFLHAHIRMFLQNHDVKSHSFAPLVAPLAAKPAPITSIVVDENDELGNLDGEMPGDEHVAGEIQELSLGTNDITDTAINTHINNWLQTIQEPCVHPSKIHWPQIKKQVQVIGDNVATIRGIVKNLVEKGIVRLDRYADTQPLEGEDVLQSETKESDNNEGVAEEPADTPSEVKKFPYEPVLLQRALIIFSRFLPLTAEEEENLRYGFGSKNAHKNDDTFIELLDYELILVDVKRILKILASEIAKTKGQNCSKDQCLRDIVSTLIAGSSRAQGLSPR